MDEQRALLDQLMGRERDVPLHKRTNRQRHFSDKDVCKFHLCGICPYVLFSNTKSDLGDHPNKEEDDEKMKEMYLALSESEREKYGYERDLLRFLEDLVSQVDRKVERNRERCNLENADSGIPEDKLKRMLTIEVEIREKTEKSEKLAEEGEVDEAQALLEEVTALRREKDETEKQFTQIKTVKRNIVCEVSGNIMSSADNEERIMCHFQGKQYLGWKACRAKVAELRAKFAAARAPRPDRSSAAADADGTYGPSRSSRGDSRERRRRSSSRDRHRSSKDDDKSKDRDRDRKRRSRSRSKDKDRKSRKSSKERKRRSRSRSRERSRK